ncbi:hypothetical protein RRG08_033820 [Elysia crispata]|uniref:Uncharacterized protein n=1 Tax=Elysia crispata TaxID=231223 RepID=A0AAE0XV12_9GAST|nr:hypothetical protein RRG08_033820 [Elysia crispata]
MVNQEKRFCLCQVSSVSDVTTSSELYWMSEVFVTSARNHLDLSKILNHVFIFSGENLDLQISVYISR